MLHVVTHWCKPKKQGREIGRVYARKERETKRADAKREGKRGKAS